MSKIIPFNGDTFIGPEIQRLVRQFKLKTIVETGAWSCHSTRAFRQILPAPGRVITIDGTTEHLTEEFGSNALAEIKGLGIEFIVGDSAKELPPLLNKIEHPALFYLDAHGGNLPNTNPLKEEILAIAANKKSRGNCVIAIHDFQVPGKPWGYNWVSFDGAEGGPLSIAVVEPWLKAAFPNGFTHHYNEQADGCQRGIVYIEPLPPKNAPVVPVR